MDLDIIAGLFPEYVVQKIKDNIIITIYGKGSFFPAPNTVKVALSDKLEMTHGSKEMGCQYFENKVFELVDPLVGDHVRKWFRRIRKMYLSSWKSVTMEDGTVIRSRSFTALEKRIKRFQKAKHG